MQTPGKTTTYGFSLGMTERWGGEKRIIEEQTPPLLASITDNMPPTIIIQTEKENKND